MAPNNFSFAFNSVSGDDFAAAIAEHNPVLAKAHPAHPGTTRLLAELAHAALQAVALPPATELLLYHTSPEVGLELVSHPLVGSTGFIGSRQAGLQLKAAAGRAGKPIYVEMSSINPLIFLKRALRQGGTAIADEFFALGTMGSGQFCTNSRFVFVPDTDTGQEFVAAACQAFF